MGWVVAVATVRGGRVLGVLKGQWDLLRDAVLAREGARGVFGLGSWKDRCAIYREVDEKV